MENQIELNWEKALAHLNNTRIAYTEIGASGILALTLVMNPLLVRYENGERTQDLYDSIMNLE